MDNTQNYFSYIRTLFSISFVCISFLFYLHAHLECLLIEWFWGKISMLQIYWWMNECKRNSLCQGILGWLKEWMCSYPSTLTLWICSKVLCYIISCGLLRSCLTLPATVTLGMLMKVWNFFTPIWINYRTIVFIYLLILIVMNHQHLLSIFYGSYLILYITVLQCVIFHFCIYRFHCVLLLCIAFPYASYLKCW
jgi:hypothetical protein